MSTPMTMEQKVAAAAGSQNVKAAQSTAQTNAKVAQAAGARNVTPASTQARASRKP